MQGSQQDQTIREVRRSARKALARLSRTFVEWESLIAGLKADVADQEKATDSLRTEIASLPSIGQMDELNSKIGDLRNSVDEQRRIASETADNRDNWKEESVRLQEQLRDKNKEISKLEVDLKRSSKQAEETRAEELAAIQEQLDEEKSRVNERLGQIERLRGELREQREQKAALERKVEDLLCQLGANENENGEKIDPEEVDRLRKDLEKARESLARLSKIEDEYWESEKTVHELKKSAESREAANQALKNSVDSLREHKIDARHQIEKLQQRVEEMQVAAKMAEAREAQIRAKLEDRDSAESVDTSDTMRLSAVASQDMRMRVQNQELREKLSAQRKDMDALEQNVASGKDRLEELESSNQAQQALIEELQKDVDEFSRHRGASRKKDLEIAQLKADMQRKQDLIDGLQIEVLNLQSKGTQSAPVQMVNPDATQAYKLDPSEAARVRGNDQGHDDQNDEVARLREQLKNKDEAIGNLQKSITEVRNRYQDLAKRDHSGKTVPMLKVLDRKSAPPADDDTNSDDTASKKSEIGATVVMRRPDYDGAG